MATTNINMAPCCSRTMDRNMALAEAWSTYLNLASGCSTVWEDPHGSWLQYKSWPSTWAPAAQDIQMNLRLQHSLGSWSTDNDTISRDCMDHRDFSRCPIRNELLFISDILSLLRTRPIVLLGSVLGDRVYAAEPHPVHPIQQTHVPLSSLLSPCHVAFLVLTLSTVCTPCSTPLSFSPLYCIFVHHSGTGNGSVSHSIHFICPNSFTCKFF